MSTEPNLNQHRRIEKFEDSVIKSEKSEPVSFSLDHVHELFALSVFLRTYRIVFNYDLQYVQRTGASGKNVFCTVFPFAPQPFVHGKWESNEVGLRSDSVRSSLYSVVDTVGKSGILPRACFHPK